MNENVVKSGNLKVVFLVISLVVSIVLGVIAMFDTDSTAWHYGVVFYICVMIFFVFGYLVFSDDAFDRSSVISRLKTVNKPVTVATTKSEHVKSTPKVGLAKTKEFERKRNKRKGSRK